MGFLAPPRRFCDRGSRSTALGPEALAIRGNPCHAAPCLPRRTRSRAARRAAWARARGVLFGRPRPRRLPRGAARGRPALRMRRARLRADGQSRSPARHAGARRRRDAPDALDGRALRPLPRGGVRARRRALGGAVRRLAGARTAVSLRLHALHRGEPGAGGARGPCGRAPLVELPRQRARRGRPARHPASALLRSRALARRARRGVPGALYSALTPARFTTWLQRPISFLMIAPSSSGEPPAGSRPSLARIFSTSLDLSASLTSLLRRATMSFGSPLGPTRPCQLVTS